MKDLEHKSNEELEIKSFKRDHITFCNYLKADCSQVGISLFSQLTLTKGNGLKLCQVRFIWDIRKNFFTHRVVKYVLSLEVPKKCIHVVLGDSFSGGPGSVRFLIALDDLDDLGSIFQL